MQKQNFCSKVQAWTYARREYSLYKNKCIFAQMNSCQTESCEASLILNSLPPMDPPSRHHNNHPNGHPNKNTRWTNPTIYPQRTTLGPLVTPKQQPPKQQTFNAPFSTLVCTKVRINWPITIFLSPQICTRTKSLRLKRLDSSLILISSSVTLSATASSVQPPKFSVHFRCRYLSKFCNLLFSNSVKDETAPQEHWT